MGIVSYAQNFEDVLLWRALQDVENGFYIDVGAQDPLIDSVSLAFQERGWRGIHVEPTVHYATLLRQQRPGDVVIQAALGDQAGVLPLYEIPGTGISTLDPDIAAQHRKRGFDVRETTSPIVTLASVLNSAGRDAIHWLKIDVEGFERQVITGWGDSKVRPWIVVVESTLPLTQIQSYESWEPQLLALGYVFAYFDGLNRYYVSEAQPALLQSFRAPPNVFDGFALNGTASATFHHRITQRVESQIGELNQRLNQQAEAAQLEAAALKASAATREAQWAESREALSHQAAKERVRLEREAALSEQLAGAIHALREQQALGQRLVEAHRDQQAELTQAHAEHKHASLAAHQAAQHALHQQAQAHAQVREQELAAATQREAALSAQVAKALEALQTQAHESAAAQNELLAHFERTSQFQLARLAEVQQEAARHIADMESRHNAALHSAEEAAEDRRRTLMQTAQVLEEELRQQLAAAHAGQEELRAALRELQRELSAIHASWMWRLSKPFRRNLPAPRKPTDRFGAADAPYLPSPTPPAVQPGQAAGGTVQIPLTRTFAMHNEAKAHLPAKDIDQLLSLDDEQFLHCAYLSVLGRPVDPTGFAHYLERIRLGTDKEQIVADLATSAEGRQLPADRLPGLREAIERAQRNRPSLLTRLARRAIATALQPLAAQLRSVDRRLSALSQENESRFDRLDAAIAELARARGVHIESANPPADEFGQMSPHSRRILARLRGAGEQNLHDRAL